MNLVSLSVKVGCNPGKNLCDGLASCLPNLVIVWLNLWDVELSHFWGVVTQSLLTLITLEEDPPSVDVKEFDSICHMMTIETHSW